MPAIADVLAVATAAFAVTAWVLPPVHYTLTSWWGALHSLAAVGRVIGAITLAAFLSAVGLVLAVLTLAFSDRTGWGWFGLGVILALWLTCAAVLVVADEIKRRRRPDGIDRG
jgi:hypothetical protein